VYLDCGSGLRDLLPENVRFGTGQRIFATELVAAFEARAPVVSRNTPKLVEPLCN
jgi:hypothetical protein